MPTLVTYAKLVSEGAAAGMATDLVAKVGSLLADGLKAVALAHKLGDPSCDALDSITALKKAHRQESSWLPYSLLGALFPCTYAA